MVWCPVSGKEIWRKELSLKGLSNVADDSITNQFMPIGSTGWMVTEASLGSLTDTTNDQGETVTATPGYLKSKQVTVSVVNSSLNIPRLDSIIYCFGIADALYQGLKARYTNMTLTFPTQILNITSMSNILNQLSCKSSQTITPRFIDTIFLLFPITAEYRTIFKNPRFFQFQLTCGGFGQYPDVQFGTFAEPRLIEMVQNALNLNNNSVAINKEVLDSLMDFTCKAPPYTGWVPSDRTNFLIAIPMETDGTFQQGQTSATPINYELIVSQYVDENTYGSATNRPPLIALLQDATISIQVMADGSPALVEVGPFDITSPVSG
jgi:hypothetical protein